MSQQDHGQRTEEDTARIREWLVKPALLFWLAVLLGLFDYRLLVGQYLVTALLLNSLLSRGRLEAN